MSQKVHVACHFYYLFDIEGLLKVTASHIHWKCGNILEMVPNRVAVTIDR